MFVTTHYMLEAEYCDRISIMKTGDVVAWVAEELKRAEDPWRMFHLPCERCRMNPRR